MKPISYIACLDQMYQSEGFPPYRWSEFDSGPWTPFEKPLDQARIALVSSAGISRKDQESFDPWAVNGLSFREIPAGTAHEDLELNHNYFDHRDAVKDMNCVFPLQRLGELAEAGYIGSVAGTAISLGMGRLYKRTALQNETTPRIVDVLKGEETDAVLLVAA
jgi:D-proline reductase (dithiol) PrdB